MLDNMPHQSPSSAVLSILCVDLDGTLLRTDTLIEQLLAATKLGLQPLSRAARALFDGKARFKAVLAELVPLDVARLPYHEPLLAYLRAQRAAGRTLVLATASHRRTAEAVADSLNLFDAVVASDDRHNLRGEAKARRLAEEYGNRGFAYVGGDASDLPVWRVAGSAVVVGASKAIAARIPCSIEACFPRQPIGMGTLVRAMRLHQWVKNFLLFLPLVTSNALVDLQKVLPAVIAFLCFGIVASGVYVLNDLADLDADRGHASKRHRPLASGAMPLIWGMVLGPLLIVAGVAGAFYFFPQFAFWLLVYVAVSLAYSAYLKSVPLLDAFVLSGLYLLRVVAGGAVTGLHVSIWLLNFAGLLFLSLAFVKRFVEISRTSGQRALLDRRGYLSDEAHLVLGLGLASAFSSSVVLGLYVSSDVAHAMYAAPEFIWGLVPLSLFWQCRTWLMALRDKVDDDPILSAIKDRGTWAIAGLAGLCYTLAAAPPW